MTETTNIMLIDDTEQKLRADIISIYKMWREASGDRWHNTASCIHAWETVVQNTQYFVNDCIVLVRFTLGDEKFLVMVEDSYCEGDY